MKYFNKINYIIAQIDFPEEWGNPFRIVDEVNGYSLADAITTLYRELVELESIHPDGLAIVRDVSNGFDTHCVRFEINDFETEHQLDDTIEWVNDQLHVAYRIITKQE